MDTDKEGQARSQKNGGTNVEEQAAASGGEVGINTGQGGRLARQSGQRNMGVMMPPVDVLEDAAGITLMADMPGVSRDNLNLRLEARNLTIEGSMMLGTPQDMQSRYAEVRHQQYERTFTLSPDLDGEQASAALSNGVLRIRIPKSQQAVPRKIPVNAA